MHLTRFTDYGLRTLIYLALRPDDRASIAEISGAYQISECHMVKVVHHLGRVGLIKTTRGRNGGIRLAHPAADIYLGAVIRATEPSLALMECLAGDTCAIGGICCLQNIMDEAQKAMLAVLDRYSLADVSGPMSHALQRRLKILHE
ncbi:MAG: Rrf2 family transcriptional regulator [Formivibrio sp.]|nr:Rrf2 family transcriptional regulator [Formivibrio sp.]